MPFCPECGKEVQAGVLFCPSCGYGLGGVDRTASEKVGSREDFTIVTTPTVPGYRISKVLGVVTGLTPRQEEWGQVCRWHSICFWGRGFRIHLGAREGKD